MDTFMIRNRLSRLSIIDEMINNKLQEVEEWRSKCEYSGTSYGTERVQSSPASPKVESALDMYISVKQEKMKEIAELEAEKKAIISDIEKLPPSEYSVIYKRYVQNKSFYQISSELDKSYSWCTWTHSKALEYLQRLMF